MYRVPNLSNSKVILDDGAASRMGAITRNEKTGEEACKWERDSHCFLLQGVEIVAFFVELFIVLCRAL